MIDVEMEMGAMAKAELQEGEVKCKSGSNAMVESEMGRGRK